jgi:hypothetical protein
MSRATHTEPEEIIDDHREVAETALKYEIGILIPGVSSASSEPKEEKGEKEEENDKGNE